MFASDVSARLKTKWMRALEKPGLEWYCEREALEVSSKRVDEASIGHIYIWLCGVHWYKNCQTSVYTTGEDWGF